MQIKKKKLSKMYFHCLRPFTVQDLSLFKFGALKQSLGQIPAFPAECMFYFSSTTAAINKKHRIRSGKDTHWRWMLESEGTKVKLHLCILRVKERLGRYTDRDITHKHAPE